MIKDEKIVSQILDMMDTAIQATGIIQSYIRNGLIENAEILLGDMISLLTAIQNISTSLKKEQQNMNLPEASGSCLVSIKRIENILTISINKSLKKLEYELEPLLQEMYSNFYFWAYVYGDKERQKYYYEHELQSLFTNKYIEEAEKTGNYRYDLSIIVRGYNKLEYTKLCVESLLKNLPEGLKYELIMVNHGSSDGTKEFFESINPDKQLDIEFNGGGLGAVARIIEGKYFIQISNDIIITENAIQNMYSCISLDKSIAWVVPSTSNVSNMQSIPAKYSTIEEMLRFATLNNKLDEKRWEQRSRLVNPVEILNTKAFIETGFYGYFYKGSNRFPDDRLSLLFRRKRKKMILAKDAYCHHFGSVTHNDTSNMEDIYQKGRILFKEFFEIDPWGIGFCYDLGLFEEDFPLLLEGSKKILGINCGIGSNSLKIKELLKECGNKQVILHNLTDRPEYLYDLRGISDKADLFTGWYELCRKEEYDYIIIEDSLDKERNISEILKIVKLVLCSKGILIIGLRDRDLLQHIKKHLQAYTLKVSKIDSSLRWVIWNKE